MVFLSEDKEETITALYALVTLSSACQTHPSVSTKLNYGDISIKLDNYGKKPPLQPYIFSNECHCHPQACTC